MLNISKVQKVIADIDSLGLHAEASEINNLILPVKVDNNCESVTASKDGFTLQDLNSAISKLTSMTEDDIISALVKGGGSKYRNIKFMEKPRFMDSLYFSSALKGLTAVYRVKIDNDSIDIAKNINFLYVTWNGQDYLAV